MCGKRLKDWKTMPTRDRSEVRSASAREIVAPSTTMSPDWIRSRAFTQRISVLLPEPEGPQTTTSPVETARLMSRRTWSRPNHLLTDRNSIAVSAMAPQRG
jgi:hypothetical protein